MAIFLAADFGTYSDRPACRKYELQGLGGTTWWAALAFRYTPPTTISLTGMLDVFGKVDRDIQLAACPGSSAAPDYAAQHQKIAGGDQGPHGPSRAVLASTAAVLRLARPRRQSAHARRKGVPVSAGTDATRVSALTWTSFGWVSSRTIGGMACIRGPAAETHVAAVHPRRFSIRAGQERTDPVGQLADHRRRNQRETSGV